MKWYFDFVQMEIWNHCIIIVQNSDGILLIFLRRYSAKFGACTTGANLEM